MIIIFIIGLSLILWGLWPVFRFLYYSPFESTKIISLNSSVSIKKESRRYIYVDVYWVSIEYEYCVKGSIYKSNRLGLSDGLKFQSKDSAKKFISKFENKKECIYSTKNPKKSILEKSLSIGPSDNTYTLIFSGALIVSVYFYLSHFLLK